ncbi:MAG: c-type cytochrome [Peptococcaceae bacterium]|nr:c-type cytochrome [Peptococcaceae bacterium]
MKLRTFLVLSGLSFVLFVAVNLISWQLPLAIPQSAAAGKLVWQHHNCISCHTLFGNGGYVGEDLTHIVAKYSSSELVTYLVNPPVMRPNKHTLHPALSEPDAEQLVTYLEYVRTLPTLGWPPQPEKAGDYR